MIQGGGGNSELVADGGGGPLAPLVLFAGTSQNGSFYNSTLDRSDRLGARLWQPGDAA